MKKIYLGVLCILFLISSCRTSYAQGYQKVRRVVPVLNAETFCLNGGLNSTFGGKSRNYFNIELPANTIECYYIVTVSADEQTAKKQASMIHLAAQLSKLLDKSGVTAIAVEALSSPSGTAVCDIFMLDQEYSGSFLAKADESWKYYTEGSRFNIKSGAVKMNKNLRNFGIGVRNPSTLSGICASIEVAAIVEETELLKRTEAETYTDMAIKAISVNDIESATELTQKALLADKNFGRAYGNLGLIALYGRQEKSAYAHYAQAVSLCKKRPYARWNIRLMKEQIEANENVSRKKEAIAILELLNSEINLLPSGK